VDLGYLIADAVALGVRFAWSSSTVTFEGDDIGSQGSLMLLPYVEWVLLEGERIRPAFGATIGLLGRTVSTTFDDETTERSYSGFLYGATAGVHFFASETFSIAPVLGLFFSDGSTETDTPGTDPDPVDTSVVTVMLAVELAGWIGGGPAPSPTLGGPATHPDEGETPRAQSPPPAVVAPPGAVTGGVALGGGVWLRLAGTWQHPDTAQARLHLIGMQARFRDCDVLIMSDGAQTLRASRRDYRIGPLASGVEEVATFELRRTTLEHLAESAAPSLALCDVRWDLDARMRGPLDIFARRLRSEAARFGTLDATPPAPPEPEPSPDPAQPPPAAPVEPPPGPPPPAM
jgi:hypothetical protein